MMLKGKTFLISGAASGLGESTARLMASLGANVVIGDILDEEATRVAESIISDGGSASTFHLDVRSESDWIDAVHFAVSSHGGLNGLVSNAGISGMIPDVMDTEYFDRLIAIHARGTFLGIKHSAPAIARAGGGSIVAISSIAGRIGADYVHMGYNAAKAAILLLVKSAAGYYAKDNIRSNAVVPGWMPPMRTSVASADPELRPKLLKSVPLGRTGLFPEVAEAVVFLSSDAASYINGVELPVDGGFLAYRAFA
jgi:NAD(P)-dependent dehydrogenase (short-subunit alcohol dehydrogenase family)